MLITGYPACYSLREVSSEQAHQ